MEVNQELSKRERQIMDAVYQLGQATVAEVLERIPDPPSYSAVRATMRVLVDKGHLRHKQDGPRYLYVPTVPQDKAKTAAVSHLVGTFFNGSMEAAVMTLLQMSEAKLSKNDIERLRSRIRDAEKEGR
ncbi:MAG TPA: BlaI/MecI/CopY family transcriptional regulator [Gemmatimonadaceae bacterium]|nr:BlaI/MecI/CopY family transcriptional regulator [Gemmatimonadaceae bacterium]